MSTPLSRAAKLVYARLAISVLSFLTFLGFVVNTHLIEHAHKVPFYSLAFLVLAVFILPRDPRGGAAISLERDPERSKQQRNLRLRLDRIGRFCTYLRLAYFLIACFCFFVLPSLLPPPLA